MWRVSVLTILSVMVASPALAGDDMAACDGPDLRQSIEACTVILRKTEPDAVQFLARRNRAIRELAIDDFVGARDDAERAIRLNASDVVIRVVAASALAKMSKYDEAKRQVDTALKLDPNSVQALTTKSLIEVKIGDDDAAIQAASRAIELHPDDPAAFNNRGLAYRSKGDYAKALLDFDQTVRFSPQNARVFLNRGVTYKMMGNRQAALKDLDEAIHLDPKIDQARLDRDNINDEISETNANALHRKAMERMDAQTQASLYIVAMQNKAKGGSGLTADETARINSIRQDYPEMRRQIDEVFRWQSMALKKNDDLGFSSRRQKECRQRRFSEEEMRRLGAIDRGQGAASLVAHIVLQCQQGYVSQFEDEAKLRRVLASAPAECQSGFDKLNAFVKDRKSDLLVEANSLAGAGDSEGACKIIDGVVEKAEAVRADMVACYHVLPESPSDDESTLKQAALLGAGQMHAMQESLAEPMQKLRCGG